jgi:DNA-binding transcriptional LysR family regulator
MLRKFKTFVAIADTGSFYSAAERVRITQSAVSMQMKSLEAHLQMELFDRTVRPPRLNATGRLMLERIRELVHMADALVDVAPVASQFRGSIELGTIPGASFVLPETLFRLNRTFTHLQVRVSSSLTEDLIEKVARDRLDAALVTAAVNLEPALTARSVLREPLLVLAPKTMAGMSDVELLEGNRYISYNRRAEVSRLIDGALKQRNIAVDPIMELDTLETFQMMIVKGLGVGILPMSSVREHLRDSFYTVPFGSPVVQRHIVLVQRRSHERQDVLDALYETFREVVRELPAAKA